MVRWVRGQSGNPSGRRRRGKSVAELLRAVAAEVVAFGDAAPGAQLSLFDPPEAATMTRRERLARVLWTMALEGDLAAARLITAYMEGQPVQPVVAGVMQQPHFTADDWARAAAALADWRGELDRGALLDAPAAAAEEDGEPQDDAG